MSYKQMIFGKGFYNPISSGRAKGAIQQYLLPRTKELSGRTLSLSFDDYSPLELSFEDGTRLTWRGGADEVVHTGAYDCVKATDAVYFINFMTSDPCRCISLVWDRDTTLATMVLASVGDDKRRPRLVSHRLFFGAELVRGQQAARTQQRDTNDLTGKRILWTYNPNDEVLHIFSSNQYFRLGRMAPTLYARASEQDRKIFEAISANDGLLPIYEEPAFYARLSERLYLYGPTEDITNRIFPSGGGNQLLFLLDVKTCRYVGRIFGLDRNGAPEYLPITAIGRFSDEPDMAESLPFPLYPQYMTQAEIARYAGQTV